MVHDDGFSGAAEKPSEISDNDLGKNWRYMNAKTGHGARICRYSDLREVGTWQERQQVMFGDRMGRPRRFDRIEGDVMLVTAPLMFSSPRAPFVIVWELEPKLDWVSGLTELVAG